MTEDFNVINKICCVIFPFGFFTSTFRQCKVCFCRHCIFGSAAAQCGPVALNLHILNLNCKIRQVAMEYSTQAAYTINKRLWCRLSYLLIYLIVSFSPLSRPYFLSDFVDH